MSIIGQQKEIFEEIRRLNPEVIEDGISDEEIKWQTTARGIWYFKDGTTTVISFSHPAARIRDCYLYYALMDAIMEILK